MTKLKENIRLKLLTLILLVSNICLGNNNDFEKLVVKSKIYCDYSQILITEALEDLDGVKHIDFDLDFQIIIVEFDPIEIGEDLIKETITDAGFTANELKPDEDAYNELPDCAKNKEDRQGTRADEIQEDETIILEEPERK